jgi:hypothetical protein
VELDSRVSKLFIAASEEGSEALHVGCFDEKGCFVAVWAYWIRSDLGVQKSGYVITYHNKEEACHIEK